MLRALLGIVLGVLTGAAPPPVLPLKGPPPRPTATRLEAIDAKVDRSLTGRVEKVEAADESSGTLRLRSSGPPGGKLYRYAFQIDGKTKVLTAKGETLEDGLKSKLLTGAEVRVEFVDQRPKGDKPLPAGMRYARTVQLIRPGK